MKWISINEALPKSQQAVLVCNSKTWTEAFWYAEDERWEYFHCEMEEEFEYDVVTHWLSIELPKKEPKIPNPNINKPIKKQRRPINKSFNSSLKKKSNFNFWG